MGLTVSPLTTAVLGSIPDQYSGTASGINNAVARTAGVLAIAILGAVALFGFRSQLAAQTTSLGLSTQALDSMQAGSSQLGALQAPTGLPPDQQAKVTQAIDQAFVNTVNLILYINAGLAWLSAAAAFWLVRDKAVNP